MNVTQLFNSLTKECQFKRLMLCYCTVLQTDRQPWFQYKCITVWLSAKQPQSFVFSVVNKTIIGTCYLVYKLPSHLIPLTDCCACINCDLCRLPSIYKKRLCSNFYWCWNSTKSKQTWHVFIYYVRTWLHWAKLHP